jgi:uncharacterized membrane protein YeaQ/YmgE (transglycosylase-associated protein family)
MIIIWFLVVGLIAGLLARAVVPGRDPIGILGTIVLGIVGAIVGGFLAHLIGDNNGVGIIGSTIGAIIVLLIYNAATGRRHHTVA